MKRDYLRQMLTVSPCDKPWTQETMTKLIKLYILYRKMCVGYIWLATKTDPSDPKLTQQLIKCNDLTQYQFRAIYWRQEELLILESKMFNNLWFIITSPHVQMNSAWLQKILYWYNVNLIQKLPDLIIIVIFVKLQSFPVHTASTNLPRQLYS